MHGLWQPRRASSSQPSSTRFQPFKYSNHQFLSPIFQPITYLVSIFVCGRLEYVTLSFPCHANAVPTFPVLFRLLITFSHMEVTSFRAIVASNASAPQQCLICLCMFPVDLASPLSRYWQTLCLHPMEAHLKTWHQWPSSYVVSGTGLKKVYTGDVHCFFSRSNRM